MTEGARLEPCPFCGVSPEERNGYLVHPNIPSECPARYMTMNHNAAGIAAWNTRASRPSPDTSDLVKRLRATATGATFAGSPLAALLDEAAAAISSMPLAGVRKGVVEEAPGARDLIDGGFLAGLEAAAQWHDQRRRDTPDAFEMEFHEVSAAAIRLLADGEKGGG